MNPSTHWSRGWADRGIKRTVEIARKRGEISIEESNEVLARLIFEIYQIECRHWLADAQPDVEQGLAKLRRTLCKGDFVDCCPFRKCHSVCIGMVGQSHRIISSDYCGPENALAVRR